MQWLMRVLDNLAFMLITIVVLVAGFYVVLLLLEWGLKLKTGAREQEGLVDLLQETMTKPPSEENGRRRDDKSPR